MNSQLPRPIPISRPPLEAAAASSAEMIEVNAIVLALRRNKWLILACIVLAGALAVQFLRTSQPSYFSSVEILLDTRQERIVDVEQVVSELSVTDATVAGEVAVLRSNLLLGRVVDQLNLVNHPDFDPYKVEPPGLIKRLRDALHQELLDAGIRLMPPASGLDAGAVLSPQDARNIVIEQLRRDLSISQSGISYVIAISMSARDPVMAARIANAVADQYIQDQLDGKLMATQRAIDWLDKRLVGLERDLRAAEDAVVEFRGKQIRDEGGNAEGAAQQLTQLNLAIVEARNERTSAEASLQQARWLLEEGGSDAAAAALETPRLLSLDGELSNLERQRAQQATRLGPRHPEMQELQLAIDDLLRDRDAAIDGGIRKLEATVAQARSREEAIAADIQSTLQTELDLSRSSVRLSQLERTASATRRVYESFLSRFQETTQQLEFQRPDARIITEAQPPLRPARPRKDLILVVALAMGMTVGVALAVGREALNRSVRSAAQLTRVSGTPVMAALPARRRRVSLRRILTLGLWRPSARNYEEALRMLRQVLVNPSTGDAPKVVMMTGAEWGVGCSDTLRGLARVLSDVGRRVVVVEANFRRPRQAKLWGLRPSGHGLAEYLRGDAALADVKIQPVERNAFVIPAYGVLDNCADLLSGLRFRALIEALSATHDIVLIAAPPAEGIADTAILSEFADAIVVVAQCHRTKVETVSTAIDTIESSGAAVTGIILTGSDSRMKVSGIEGLPRSKPVPQKTARLVNV